MMYSLEGVHDLAPNMEGCYAPTELSESQLSYLKELNIPSEQWEIMDATAQTTCLSAIFSRFEEMGITNPLVIENALLNAFSPEIAESYNRIEMAPHDMEQIEQISDTMKEMSEFRIENWEKLELNERVEALNTLEAKIAEIEHRPAYPVHIADKGAIEIKDGTAYGMLGGFNPETKSITLNAEMVGSNHPTALRETLDTIIHEGRHAYQEYNVNECEIHPRHAEVVGWSETMTGGKWGYWGNSNTIIGQRLYEQQSVEIDARNFAADILNKYDEKYYA